jgi:hypothetical protein
MALSAVDYESTRLNERNLQLLIGSGFWRDLLLCLSLDMNFGNFVF